MTEPRTDTQTLIAAMEILSRDIQSDDGVANAAIAESAGRLRELDTENEKLRTSIDKLVENAKSQSATSLVVLSLSKAMNGRIAELEDDLSAALQRGSVLITENERLTAQVAAGDVLRSVLMECKTECAEGLESHAEKVIEAYDNAKKNQTTLTNH